MVGRLEAQEPPQHCCRVLAANETQERARKPLQTSEEGSILDQAPRQHAIEALIHGGRADGYAQLEMVERKHGHV